MVTEATSIEDDLKGSTEPQGVAEKLLMISNSTQVYVTTKSLFRNVFKVRGHRLLGAQVSLQGVSQETLLPSRIG